MRILNVPRLARLSAKGCNKAPTRCEALGPLLPAALRGTHLPRRRPHLDDRPARRSYLNDLAGLDAGRERDADLHFLCRLVSRARRRRRRSGREQVVRARRARAGRRPGFLARAVGSSGPGASQRAEALLQPLVEKRASLGTFNSRSAPPCGWFL